MTHPSPARFTDDLLTDGSAAAQAELNHRACRALRDAARALNWAMDAAITAAEQTTDNGREGFLTTTILRQYGCELACSSAAYQLSGVTWQAID